MKSLLLAPALVSFVNTDLYVDSLETSPVVTELVAIATVVDPPIVELEFFAEFVPVVAEEEEVDRVHALRRDIDALGTSLTATQEAVEEVARQRDQARGEVRALAKANHEILTELKAFRHEMEMARKETEEWKSRSIDLEKRANDRVLAKAEMLEFRDLLGGAMEEFRALKGDLAQARLELQDPIERANLKEQLAQANTKRLRLNDEIEMALIARERTILEAARTRKDLEGQMASLRTEAQSAKEMRDELRSANAVKMKALADVEVLRKEMERSGTALAETSAALKVAQEGIVALQAEKGAAVESRSVAQRERDEARAGVEHLQNQVEEVRAEAEFSKLALAELTAEMKDLEVARQTADQELEQSSTALDQAHEDLAFLNRAKGGLEQLLFTKNAELMALKDNPGKTPASGKLKFKRKMQASDEKSSGPPESPKREDPAEESEDGNRNTAGVLAAE